MISTHEIRIFNTFLPLAQRYDWHGNTSAIGNGVLIIRCIGHDRQGGQINQPCRNQCCGHAAYGHGLLTQPHLDIARWTDILTDVATDTLVVVGVNIAAHGGMGFLNPENGILGTEN